MSDEEEDLHSTVKAVKDRDLDAQLLVSIVCCEFVRESPSLDFLMFPILFD